MRIYQWCWSESLWFYLLCIWVWHRNLLFALHSMWGPLFLNSPPPLLIISYTCISPTRMTLHASDLLICSLPEIYWFLSCWGSPSICHNRLTQLLLCKILSNASFICWGRQKECFFFFFGLDPDLITLLPEITRAERSCIRILSGQWEVVARK